MRICRRLVVLGTGDGPAGSAVDVKININVEAQSTSDFQVIFTGEVQPGPTCRILYSGSGHSCLVRSHVYAESRPDVECRLLGRPAMPRLIRRAAKGVAQHVNQMVGGRSNAGTACTLRT